MHVVPNAKATVEFIRRVLVVDNELKISIPHITFTIMIRLKNHLAHFSCVKNVWRVRGDSDPGQPD